ncbi:MAG: EexN family lipoprotein [Pseudomonadota bacterium]|nr:EexN family lipoprotein [Pseudomonadota bacterium]
MKLNSVVLACLVAVALSACTKVQTVEYYKEHPDKAKKVIAECDNKKSKGDLNDKDLENCSNAAQAYVSAVMGEAFKDIQ